MSLLTISYGTRTTVTTAAITAAVIEHDDDFGVGRD